MFRLSYRLTSDDRLVSNLLLCNDYMVFVLINPSDCSFEIRGINDETVWLITGGVADDIKKCKTIVRKELEKIGIVFSEEIRRKINEDT